MIPKKNSAMLEPSPIESYFDGLRYFMALMFVIAIPPGLVFWFLIHPFIRLWRRIGAASTYMITFGIMVLVGIGMYRIREIVLNRAYDMNWWVFAAGILLFSFSRIIAVQWRRKLKFGILFGFPELDPQGHPGVLLRDGIYGKIRHPRYTEGALGLLGWSLIVQYPALYYLTLASWIGIYFIVIIEERELRRRWGKEYEDYCAQVPRFFPKWPKTV